MDFYVSYTDVEAAARALEETTREAGTLPKTTGDAYAELDMAGSKVSGATATFLKEWAEGLYALEEAGKALHAWLLGAVDFLRQVDAAMARAAD